MKNFSNTGSSHLIATAIEWMIKDWNCGLADVDNTSYRFGIALCHQKVHMLFFQAHKILD